MGTRLFRNANGILAVERDGVLVYGPDKVYRAVDVTIENRPSEHWVALAENKWRGFDGPLGVAATGANRIERVLGGKAAVFSFASTALEATVTASINAFVPPRSEIETALAALQLWRDDPTKLVMTKSEVLNMLKLLGV